MTRYTIWLLLLLSVGNVVTGCPQPCDGYYTVCVPPRCIPNPIIIPTTSTLATTTSTQPASTTAVGTTTTPIPTQQSITTNPPTLPTTTLLPTPTPKRLCPKDWWGFGTYCYQVMGGAHNYFTGESHCAALGAYNVWITDDMEEKFVNTLVLSSGGLTYWIGLRKVYGAWIWPDGRPATYLRWRPTQPDGCCGADVTCAIANYVDGAGYWDDAGCYDIWKVPLYSVCKKPLP
ncbi:unnamed protein product [Toxocara canis]|uniref:C-type lectin domain-containing protein n=1 Tax=Toxocara canis TaxID=6265 RepID=A0A183V6I9_TOXCA|nr:unnamed protein product [Toxocara canis]